MARSFARSRPRLAHALTVTAAMALSVPGCDDGAAGPMLQDTGDDSTSTGEPPYDSPACHAGEAPSLEIGDGSGTFVPATELDLVYGPQGGHHIVIGLKLTDFEPSSPIEARLEGRVDGALRGSGSVSIGLQCSESEDALIASGLLLIWDAPPEEVSERDVEVFVRVTNGDGESVENTTTLYVHDNGPGETE